MICKICGLIGVFAYCKVMGERVCVPCLSACVDAYKKYIIEVVGKAKKYPPTWKGE